MANKYNPTLEPVPDRIPNETFRACIQECSPGAQIEVDMMVNYLIAIFKGHRLGRNGALELLARLIQLGLIGPGLVHREWLERRVRG